MASATDFFNELKGANTRLDDIKTKLDGLQATADAINQTLQWGFVQLITLGVYTNQALAENAKQNDTIICILEHISKNTCELLNEAHIQTGLQTIIEKKTTILADLYAASHGDAAFVSMRLEALQKQIEACCPPKPPKPVCDYQPCPKPPPLGDPPPVDPQPPGTIE
jgi:hypothetical protein